MLYLCVFLITFLFSFVFLTRPFLKAAFVAVPMWVILLFHASLALVVTGLIYFWR